MPFLIADASTARFSSTQLLDYSSNFTSFINGNDSQGLTASASGTANNLYLYISDLASVTNLKACLYEGNVLVETVVIPASVGTGVVSVALAGTTTITSGNVYRLAIYSESGQDFTMFTDVAGLTLRVENGGSGSFATPIDPYPAGSFQSNNEFYWAIEEAATVNIGLRDTAYDSAGALLTNETNITVVVRASQTATAVLYSTTTASTNGSGVIEIDDDAVGAVDDTVFVTMTRSNGDTLAKTMTVLNLNA